MGSVPIWPFRVQSVIDFNLKWVRFWRGSKIKFFDPATLRPNVPKTTRIHIKNEPCVNITADVWKKWPPRCPKPLHLLSENETMQNFEYGLCFIGNFKNWTTRNDRLDVWFPVFLKIIKKSMSISPQTYEKSCGATILKMNMTKDGRQKLWFSLKKHWFLCDAQLLALRPDLDLGRNVRTPNSVWWSMRKN